MTFVILGSEKVGQTFAEAARGLREPAKAVECYQTSLAAINMNIRLQKSSQIRCIIFVRGNQHDDTILADIGAGAPLLDLGGAKLIEKLVVVLPFAGHWNSLYETAGMRTFRFDKKLESAVKLLQALLTCPDEPQPRKNILAAGYSGHGKSQLLNVLVGEDVLAVAKDTLGSTTEAIHRVQWDALDIRTQHSYRIDFDDTPGFGGNTFDRRAHHEQSMRQYKDRFHPTSSPTLILLAVAWGSITPETHNAPHQFTSPLGITLNNLQRCNLLDITPGRNNVLVVVTKSLSFWSDLDDYETTQEKEMHWRIEAGRRSGIIKLLQRQMFPGCKPWSIVFMENESIWHSQHTPLPNTDIGCHKLWVAIEQVLGHPNGEVPQWDPNSSRLMMRVKQKILVDPQNLILQLEELKSSELAFAKVPTSRAEAFGLQERVIQYLGMTCDPAAGLFGRTSALKTADTKSYIMRHPKQKIKVFAQASFPSKSRPSVIAETLSRIFRGHLRRGHIVPGVEKYYANWAAIAASQEGAWKMFACQYVTAEAQILSQEISPDLKIVVEKLPKWSKSNKVVRNQYHDFFSSHGNQVALRVALGGVIWIVVRDRGTIDIRGKVTKKQRKAANGKLDINVFQEGGSSVASELVSVLQKQLKQHPFHLTSIPWPSSAESLSRRWIDAVKRDPVFCPDSHFTTYAPIHTLTGLPAKIRKDLAAAYRFFNHSYGESSPRLRQSQSRVK